MPIKNHYQILICTYETLVILIAYNHFPTCIHKTHFMTIMKDTLSVPEPKLQLSFSNQLLSIVCL